MKLQCQMTIELSLDQLAEAFANLDDDSQAQFFCRVAAIALTWKGFSKDMQWYYVGKHLRECECSTDDGREMLREIVRVMDDKTKGTP